MKKIPVGRTIAAAYRFTFAGLEKVIALIWLPMIVITIGDYFTSGAMLSGRAFAIESGDSAGMQPVVAAQFGFAVLELVLLCVIGIAITREILSPMEQRPSFFRFSLGMTELRAAGGLIGVYLFVVLVSVVVVIAGLLLAGALGKGGGDQAAIRLAVFIFMVALPVLVPILARLSYFIFPAVLSDSKFGLEASWTLTKGNVLRIIAISLAVGLPPLLIGQLANVFVLGPETLNPHLELWNNKAAIDRAAVEQARQMAAHLPLLKGIEFLLAPFFYGLVFSAPAFAFKFLSERED
ncbi:hypothetical protein FHS83_000278 [Rhizomicrobium palustre]|uniref:Uncharacterized protein n=1 Tax=Rhizomicrobium palustre TaxID=189966 RepID=A0A846MV63_9PROT|nr:hypothetical protein [Rhizomicrobium palustre]NIK86960.1 hypothetical protein [Rhizomicrobium palustre]